MLTKRLGIESYTIPFDTTYTDIKGNPLVGYLAKRVSKIAPFEDRIEDIASKNGTFEYDGKIFSFSRAEVKAWCPSVLQVQRID